MKKYAGLVLCSAVLAGCQNMHMQQSYDSMGQSPYFQPASSAPANGYQPQGQAPQQQGQQRTPVYVSNGMSDEVIGQVRNLNERVRRVERAMIRLDRRMQLIERNELSRMTNGVMEGDSTQAPNQGVFQPMSYPQPQTQNAPSRLPAVNQPFARPVAGGYQPVSYQDNRITSSLGVASKSAARKTAARASAGGAFSGMPSLADDSSKSSDDADNSVSIWTIEYESGKVWPAREQLVSSRNVIRALAGEKPVAIYARGARPSSKEFRERVRAVSKYLSKVAKVSNVPIASMPAKHMNGDTIEIIVTK
ncbi:MAG: hypothetical protein VX154_07970 [Pseudomonadota bacterium]|nr:hypothetical protein [Pseudomonadota bacterium]